MSNPLDNYDCQVFYRDQLLGVTTTNGRHDLIRKAIEEGKISGPLAAGDIEFRWVKPK